MFYYAGQGTVYLQEISEKPNMPAVFMGNVPKFIIDGNKITLDVEQISLESIGILLKSELRLVDTKDLDIIKNKDTYEPLNAVVFDWNQEDQKYYRLLFEGLDVAQSSMNIHIMLAKIKFGDIQNFEVIGDEIAKFSLCGQITPQAGKYGEFKFFVPKNIAGVDKKILHNRGPAYYEQLFETFTEKLNKYVLNTKNPESVIIRNDIQSWQLKNFIKTPEAKQAVIDALGIASLPKPVITDIEIMDGSKEDVLNILASYQDRNAKHRFDEFTDFIKSEDFKDELRAIIKDIFSSSPGILKEIKGVK